jgi:hypothetical protein
MCVPSVGHLRRTATVNGPQKQQTVSKSMVCHSVFSATLLLFSTALLLEPKAREDPQLEEYGVTL